MSTGSSRTLIALALQLMALAALSLSLLGFSWLDARSRPRVLVLVDRSASVPREASDLALAAVVHAAKAAVGGDLQLLEFAGRPAAPAAHPTDSVANLDPSATNIEAALEAALTAHAQAPVASVIVISDGLANVGDTARALHAAREARLPLQWIAVGHPRRRPAFRRCWRPTARWPASRSGSPCNWRAGWIDRFASRRPRAPAVVKPRQPAARQMTKAE